MSESRCYAIGPDALTKDEEAVISHNGTAKCMVYWYHNDGDEASGAAFVILPGGTIELWHLDHCSCHGPTQNYDTERLTAEDALKRLDYDESGVKRKDTDFDAEQWAMLKAWAKGALSYTGW